MAWLALRFGQFKVLAVLGLRYLEAAAAGTDAVGLETAALDLSINEPLRHIEPSRDGDYGEGGIIVRVVTAHGAVPS